MDFGISTLEVLRVKMPSASPLSACKSEKNTKDSTWPWKRKFASKSLSQPTNSVRSLSGANTLAQSAKRPREEARDDDPLELYGASQKRRVESHTTPRQATIEPPLSVRADNNCSNEHEVSKELGSDGDTEDENQVVGTVSAASGLGNEPHSSDNGLNGGTGLQGEGTVTAKAEETAADPSSLRTALLEVTPSPPEPDDIYQFLSQKDVTLMPSPNQRDKERREISLRAAEIAAEVEPDDRELTVGLAH